MLAFFFFNKLSKCQKQTSWSQDQGPQYVGSYLGSNVLASISETLLLKKKNAKNNFFQVSADGFFMSAILYPRMQCVKRSNSTAKFFILNGLQRSADKLGNNKNDLHAYFLTDTSEKTKVILLLCKRYACELAFSLQTSLFYDNKQCHRSSTVVKTIIPYFLY